MATKAQIHIQAPSAAKSLLQRATAKRAQDDLVNHLKTWRLHVFNKDAESEELLD
jgi:hypothetical protein